MRKIIIVFIIILLFSSCAKDKKQIDIAIIGKTNDFYWNNVKLGAESAGKDLDVNVNFYVPSREDPAWQMRKLEEIISKPIDGVAVAASDLKSIESVMSSIVQSNIPCLALDKDVAKGRHAYIGTANYFAGQQAGELMAEILEYEGTIAIITDPSVPDFAQRIQGFRDIINEHGNMGIKLNLEKQYDSITTSDIESLLGLDSSSEKSSISNVKGIFCVSDSIGVITAKALKASKYDQAKVVCIGESPEIMKAVQENIIQVAISRRPYRLGYSSVLVLHNMIKAGINNTLIILPKSEIVDPGVVILTPSNVEEYKEQLSKLGAKPKF